jgi:hypothetical protein
VTACQAPGCNLPAAALVAAPHGAPGAPLFAIVRPVTATTQLGEPRCLDCAHHALDLMLMRAREETL